MLYRHAVLLTVVHEQTKTTFRTSRNHDGKRDVYTPSQLLSWVRNLRPKTEAITYVFTHKWQKPPRSHSKVIVAVVIASLLFGPGMST